MNKKGLPIGFFDSGVGGLSVMREALKLMPNENYIYFGDSKNAPYGTKEMNEVRDLTFDAVEFLLSKGAKAIVVACNTATSAAASELRKVYKEVPIIGIEPAVKPAVELHRNGDVIIMATPFTLSHLKFKKLMDMYRQDASIYPMPCAGLVEFIEKGDLNSNNVKKYLEDKFKEYENKDIAAIVLGCTHYPFIKETLSEVVGGDIPIIDGGEGTARELKRKLEDMDLISDSKTKGEIEIYNSTGKEEIILLSKKLLEV
ncbi:glutamate racemase [Clostridium moniliforme]|uniref:Glutamate racemase n=1 Tax=Clostridium moniliforme TaxID=39489 RepID=A0ABS4F1T4_9CLOT|nr:glutamate racemase [Clostridium moniliforme]MBP1890209.1 glutamate racemase [Clostridium moniliforme]